jgi:hypothetical protein
MANRTRTALASGGKALAGPPAAHTPHPRAVTHVVAAGSIIFRIYDPASHGATADGFRYEGPHARFDQHQSPAPPAETAQGPNRGIMYGAPSFRCCVDEFFGDDGGIDPDGPYAARLEVTQDLELLDLRGLAVRKVGTIAAVAKVGEYATTQEWGRYWYEHPQRPGHLRPVGARRRQAQAALR